jgi:hypothetical protein
MSAYSTVVLPRQTNCPHCGSGIRPRIQFKYGDTQQHDYSVGDRIKWGGNDIGKPARLVTALGYPEDCPVCGKELGGVFDVIVRDGVITDVIPGQTQPYIDADNANYLVLEP